jgi:PIN domain nuclease of toxin-antitoxin system
VKVAELLDASALRAVAFDEDGAEQVMMVMSRPHLRNAVTNLTEVVSTLRQRGMRMAGCCALLTACSSPS